MNKEELEQLQEGDEVFVTNSLFREGDTLSYDDLYIAKFKKICRFCLVKVELVRYFEDWSGIMSDEDAKERSLSYEDIFPDANSAIECMLEWNKSQSEKFLQIATHANRVVDNANSKNVDLTELKERLKQEGK